MNNKSFFSCKSNEEALRLFEKRYAISREKINNIKKSDVPYLTVDFSNNNYWNISPELAYFKGKPIVLIPNIFNKYYYFDENGKKCKAPKDNDPDFEGCYRVCEPLPDGQFSSKMLYKFLFRHIPISYLLCFALLSVLAVFVGLIFPIISETVLGFAEKNTNDLTPMLWYCLYGVLVIVVGALLRSLISILQTRIGHKLYYCGHNAVIYRIFCMPVYTLETISHSDTVEISVAIYNHIISISEIALSGTVSVCFLVAYLFQLSAYLHEKTIWVLLYMLAGSALLGYLILLIAQSSRKARMISTTEKRFLISSLSGIKKIRQTGSEERFNEKWQEIYNPFLECDYKSNKYMNIQTAYSSFSIYFLTFFLLILSYFAKSSVSSFIVINIIGGCLLAQNGSLALQILNIADAVSSWNVLSSFLGKPHAEPEKLPLLPSFDGSLNIENVTYTYKESGQKALDDISIHIKPYEYLAIVGKSGCGKSTLLNLIIGRLAMQKGKIAFGDYSIKDYDRTSILSNIGIVMQDDVLIPGTVRDNLTLYCPDADDKTLWQALRDAYLYDDIEKMPYKLDTVIAGNLSGGQVQRLMLARVVVAKPSMVILDEATSALDNVSQRVIKKTLDKMPCTKIIVAHRLSTIKDCDRILVMEKGKIAEEGSYDSLLEKKGIFYDLVERQKL